MRCDIKASRHTEIETLRARKSKPEDSLLLVRGPILLYVSYKIEHHRGEYFQISAQEGVEPIYVGGLDERSIGRSFECVDSLRTLRKQLFLITPISDEPKTDSHHSF